MEKRKLGKTSLSITPLCFGCAPLGNMPTTFGYKVTKEKAKEILLESFKGPVNFFDTSNNYGDSEKRIGETLAKIGGLPKGFVIATKADRDPKTNEFTASRIRKSVKESLKRLGLKRLQLVYLHDPEKDPKFKSNRELMMEEMLGNGGPVAELEKLKDEGIIDNIGISGGPIDLLIEFIQTGRFDVVITHNRWNLLVQTAGPLLNEAKKMGIGVVNASPFASGVLATANSKGRFLYKIPTSEILDRVKSIETVCQKYDVPIKAVALRFSLLDQRINSTVVGISELDQMSENIRLSKISIPNKLWVELKKFAVTKGDLEKI